MRSRRPSPAANSPRKCSAEANAPGGKLKVMAMSSAFPTSRRPVSLRYSMRGNTGSPPNAITFRALYGSADDLTVRYEPDTGTELVGVPTNPATVSLEGDLGSQARVRSTKAASAANYLQRRREIFERRAGPAVCVSRRAAPSQRRRREHPGVDLPGTSGSAHGRDRSNKSFDLDLGNAQLLGLRSSLKALKSKNESLRSLFVANADAAGRVQFSSSS
jgi:hypothetical protein